LAALQAERDIEEKSRRDGEFAQANTAKAVRGAAKMPALAAG
jgi:hypothetical protein